VVEQAPPPSPEIELPRTLEKGARVFVNWKNYGHFYAGKVARSNPFSQQVLSWIQLLRLFPLLRGSATATKS